MTTHDAHPAFSARVLTIFPEMFPGPLSHSLAGKAMEKGIWDMDVVNIRDYAANRHKTVDDTPFGGGAGMVMRADVLDRAIEAVHTPDRPLIYLSPRGKPFDQAKARDLSEKPGVTLLCGRFEGVDERVIKARGIEEISIGDYVLSGGEPAAVVLLDAVVRLLPGVVGKTESLVFESFEHGLLEYPHYTRPREWNGMNVPDILVSGHHERVADWRKKRSEDITRTRRPDLWEKYAGRLSDKR